MKLLQVYLSRRILFCSEFWIESKSSIVVSTVQLSTDISEKGMSVRRSGINQINRNTEEKSAINCWTLGDELELILFMKI